MQYVSTYVPTYGDHYSNFPLEPLGNRTGYVLSRSIIDVIHSVRIRRERRSEKKNIAMMRSPCCLRLSFLGRFGPGFTDPLPQVTPLTAATAVR